MNPHPATQPETTSHDVGRATPPPGHSCSMSILTFCPRFGKPNFHIPNEFYKKVVPSYMGAVSAIVLRKTSTAPSNSTPQCLAQKPNAGRDVEDVTSWMDRQLGRVNFSGRAVGTLDFGHRPLGQIHWKPARQPFLGAVLALQRTWANQTIYVGEVVALLQPGKIPAHAVTLAKILHVGEKSGTYRGRDPRVHRSQPHSHLAT